MAKSIDDTIGLLLAIGVTASYRGSVTARARGASFVQVRVDPLILDIGHLVATTGKRGLGLGAILSPPLGNEGGGE